MTRRSDLAAAVGLVLLALLVSVLPLPESLQTALMLPAILFAPGYAIAAALFRPAELSPGLRLILSFALGVSLIALGELLLQVVLPLDRAVMAALLALATIAAAAIANRRCVEAPIQSSERRAPRRPHPLALAAFVVAAAIAVWSVAIASDGVQEQRAESRFTSLWVVPAEGGELRVGVSNQEGDGAAYRLDLRVGSELVRAFRFDLAEDEQWQRSLPVPAQAAPGTLTGDLYRDGDLARTVRLEIGGPS